MAFRTPKNIDRSYTRKMKELIMNAPSGDHVGLVDTWTLVRGILLTAEIDYNVGSFMSADYTFTIKIYAEEYFVYLDEPFSLTSDFINSQSFANTTEELRQYFKAYLSNEYPLLSFGNISLSLGEVEIMNQP